jgi:hypothetical protein
MLRLTVSSFALHAAETIMAIAVVFGGLCQLERL